MSPSPFAYKLLEQTEDVNSDNLGRSHHSSRRPQALARTLPLQRPGSGSSPGAGHSLVRLPLRGLSPRVAFMGKSCFSLDFLTSASFPPVFTLNGKQLASFLLPGRWLLSSVRSHFLSVRRRAPSLTGHRRPRVSRKTHYCHSAASAPSWRQVASALSLMNTAKKRRERCGRERREGEMIGK